MDIEEVWSQYQSSLKAFLRSRVSNPTEVEDLLQEIWLKTYKNLPSVRSQKSVKSWLFQIANHAIIDFYRKRGRSREFEADNFWYSEQDIDAVTELS
ncbi:MAG: sigma-70 family RNA polymerase sigma factor, partial [Cyanobacteria bacterium P01_F01_bin.53]